MSKPLTITERLKQRQQEALVNLKRQSKEVEQTRFNADADVFDPVKEVPKEEAPVPIQRPENEKHEENEKEAREAPKDDPMAVDSDSSEESSSSLASVAPATSASPHFDSRKRRKLLKSLIDGEADSSSASEDEDGNRIKKKKNKKGKKKRKRASDSDDSSSSSSSSEDEENSKDREMIDDTTYDHSKEPPPHLAFREQDEAKDSTMLQRATSIVSGAETERLYKKAVTEGREGTKARRFASKIDGVRPLGAMLSSSDLESRSTNESGSEDSAERRLREEEERKIFGDSSSEDDDDDDSDNPEESDDDDDDDGKKPSKEKRTRLSNATPLATLPEAATIDRREVIEQAAEAIEVGLSKKSLVTSEPTRRDIDRFLSALFTVASGSLPESGKNKGTRQTIVSVDKVMPFTTRSQRIRQHSVAAIKNADPPGHISPAIFRRLLGSHLVAMFPMDIVRNMTAKRECTCALTGVRIPEDSPMELLLVYLPEKKRTLSFPIAAHASVGPFGKIDETSLRVDTYNAPPAGGGDYQESARHADAMDARATDGREPPSESSMEERALEKDGAEVERAQENLLHSATPQAPRVAHIVVKEPNLVAWYRRQIEADRKKIYSNMPRSKKGGKPPVYFLPNGLPNARAYDWARIAEYYIVRRLFGVVYSDDEKMDAHVKVDGLDVWWPSKSRDVIPKNFQLDLEYVRRILNAKREPPVENIEARDSARSSGENLALIAKHGFSDPATKALHRIQNKHGHLETDNAKLRFYPRLLAAIFKSYTSRGA